MMPEYGYNEANRLRPKEFVRPKTRPTTMRTRTRTVEWRKG